MKRIVICMDGTWQTLSQDKLTNIGVLARSIAHTHTIDDGAGGIRQISQIVIYTSGVGSNVGALTKRGFLSGLSASLNRMAGGLFGEGLEDGVVDTYVRLAFNYEPGDEIYIFGFSRGAFAARRLSGLINTAGIVSRRYVERAWDAFRLYYNSPRDGASDAEKANHAEVARQFRERYGKGVREADGQRRAVDAPPPVTYLGVFDTVVQRGFDGVVGALTPWGAKRYKLKNLRVCPNVLSARHAVATDESRLGFPATLWDALDAANEAAAQRSDAKPGYKYFEQRWFIGTHGDVGGGEGSRLAAFALKWIADGAAQQGLRFYGVHGKDRSPMDEFIEAVGDGFDAPISRPRLIDIWKPIHYPIRGRKVWHVKDKPSEADLESLFDSSVLKRASAPKLRPRYRPGAMRPFRTLLKNLKSTLEG